MSNEYYYCHTCEVLSNNSRCRTCDARLNTTYTPKSPASYQDKQLIVEMWRYYNNRSVTKEYGLLSKTKIRG